MKTIATFDVSMRTVPQEFLGVPAQNPKSGPFTPKEHEDDKDEACIANISPRERLKRLVGGVFPFVLAITILIWQISTDVNRLWRLPLFILFVSAASGFFQWRDKT